MTEDERQQRIDALALKFATERSVAKRRILWKEMCELIKGRSKETVEKMERERNLR